MHGGTGQPGSTGPDSPPTAWVGPAAGPGRGGGKCPTAGAAGGAGRGQLCPGGETQLGGEPGGGLEVGHKQGYGELPCRTGISQPPLRWPCSLSPEVPETQAHGDLPAGLPAAGRLGLGSPQLGEDRGRPRLSLDPVDRAQQAVHGLQPALEDHRMPRRTPEDALCEF